MPDRVILASTSSARQAMLRAAGLSFEAEAPRVDEAAVKAGLRAEGLPVRDQADALAEVKALSISRLQPGFVIGADQMLALGDKAFDKPESKEAAKAQLHALSGRTHALFTAAVVARDGVAIWRHVSAPRLTMRRLSDDAIEDYLARAGEAAFASVGAYQLEGLGAQLFEGVDGDYFAVLGLPLLPLLGFLREHGVGGLV
ncbi:MAG: Maf family protein [Hyphomonadaceae bacterium]